MALKLPVQLSGSSADRAWLILQSRQFLLILATPKKGVLNYGRPSKWPQFAFLRDLAVVRARAV